MEAPFRISRNLTLRVHLSGPDALCHADIFVEWLNQSGAPPPVLMLSTEDTDPDILISELKQLFIGNTGIPPQAITVKVIGSSGRT